jgi:uncharacterized membrane protein
MSEMGAELFDRYVHEVRRRLPRKQRADVGAELHSLLMDALQDRLAERGAGETATEEDQVAVLRELGPPDEVAARYTPPHRTLIGARFYDMYRIVVAAVAGSITLSHLILLLLALWGGAWTFAALVSAFGEVFGNYVGAVLAGLGAVTLTFAILERALPESSYRARTIATDPFPIVALQRVSSGSALEDKGETAWDPRTMPEIQEHDQVEVGSQVAGIVFLVIALIVFNFFPEWVGIGFIGSINDGPVGWHARPLLAPIFFTRYLPWLNASWIANIGLSVVLLRQGRWRRLTRLADFALAVLGAFILYQMAFGPSLLTMEAIRSESLRETLDAILPTLLKVGLIIGFIATVIEAILKLYRVFRAKPTSLVHLLNAHKSANRS